MTAGPYSLLMAALCSTVFALGIHILRGRPRFIGSFGPQTVLTLYGLCLLRILLPVELPFAITVEVREEAWIQGFEGLFCQVWAIGSLALVLRFFQRNLRLYHELAPFSNRRCCRAQEILRGIASEHGRALRVEVCLCPMTDVPMGTGLIRRRIYLPTEDYTDRELYYILTHEYAHFLTYDLPIKLAIKLLCCVFWWDPALHLIKDDIFQMLEIRCDRNAAKDLSRAQRTEYLLTILHVLRGSGSSGELSTGLSSGGDMRERFMLVTGPERKTAVRSWVLLWGVSALFMALSYSVTFQAAAGEGSIGPPAAMSFGLICRINLGVLWLFILTQIKYQFLRNKGGSILALSAAALLCGAMAFYMGNIQSTQKALDSLAGTLPVNVTIVNREGSRKTELFIDPAMLDSLSESGVGDMLTTAEAAGAWDASARGQDPFFGGDVDMAAVNSTRAWEGFNESVMEWRTGSDGSIFASDRPVCVLSEGCAQRFGAELGGEVRVAVYTVRRNPVGVSYELVEDAAFTVCGIYHNQDGNIGHDMYIPTGWMRHSAESRGIVFSYDSAACRLSDPRTLNAFKENLPKLGFMEPFEGADNLIRGDAIRVDDEMFIKTSRNLKQSLGTLRSFQAPFCLLIVALVTMLTFLSLRGSRRDMAIASSLGQPRWQTALSHFMSTELAYLGGCMMILPETVLLAGVPLWQGLAICGIFLLCAAMGVALALMLLLRFDTLELLTKTD